MDIGWIIIDLVILDVEYDYDSRCILWILDTISKADTGPCEMWQN